MKRGFTTIELIIYVSILAAVFSIFVASFLAINRSYVQVRIINELDSAAATSLERVTKEIRNASSVDVVGSLFEVNPGELTINQVDSDNNSTTIRFTVINSVLHILKDGEDLGSLLPAGVTVSNLVFSSIDSGRSKAVRIELRLGGQIGQSTRSADYYSTVTLRGSYR